MVITSPVCFSRLNQLSFHADDIPWDQTLPHQVRKESDGQKAYFIFFVTPVTNFVFVGPLLINSRWPASAFYLWYLMPSLIGWNVDQRHIALKYKFITCAGNGLLSHRHIQCVSWNRNFVPWRHHQMEAFPVLLAICAGNSPVTGDFPHKDQWRGALTFSLICAWINGWVDTRGSGYLRRHRTHFDVTVIRILVCFAMFRHRPLYPYPSGHSRFACTGANITMASVTTLQNILQVSFTGIAMIE